MIAKPMGDKKPQKIALKAPLTDKAAEAQLGKSLIESSIKIQSKSVEILSAMTSLTKRIDKLVGLFEEASKHVTEVESTEVRIASLANKLETLLEQNKSIARGLILLEKYVRGKTEFKRAGEVEKVQEYSGL